MKPTKVILQRNDGRFSANDQLDRVTAKPSSVLEFDAIGGGRTRSLGAAITNFALLPAASVAAGTDALFLATGTGTEVVARADKGGVNLKSQATTPADGDEVLLTPVTTTGVYCKVGAGKNPTFRARLALNTDTRSFYSTGLTELITDTDPSGTAGEGALFCFDPTGEFVNIANGAAANGSTNWYLWVKVNGVDYHCDTGVSVTAGKDYELEVTLGDDYKPTFTIDGVDVTGGDDEWVAVADGSAADNQALTNGDTVAPFLGLELTASPLEQKHVDVRYIGLDRNIG